MRSERCGDIPRVCYGIAHLTRSLRQAVRRRGAHATVISPLGGTRHEIIYGGFNVARVTVEDCLERINNHFALVILAAQRARQIAGGAPRLVKCTNRSAVAALREIGAGKVAFRENLDDVVHAFVIERKKIDSDNKSAAASRRRRA
jgi:DNA-directed RNA polymerase subunit omega